MKREVTDALRLAVPARVPQPDRRGHRLPRPDRRRPGGQIVDLLAGRPAGQRLAEQDLVLELTPAASALIVREGTDPAFGARPLKRTIQRLVENPLARALVAGEFKPGDRITADADLGQRHDRVLDRGRDRRRGRDAPRCPPATGRRREPEAPAPATARTPTRLAVRPARPGESQAATTTASWSTSRPGTVSGR